MRWKPKKLNNDEPQPGSISWSDHFALLPTKLDDGFTVWWEKYRVEWKWVEQTENLNINPNGTPFMGSVWGWKKVKTYVMP